MGASFSEQLKAARSGRWLTVRDIADDLGVSLSTVYKWSSRGQPDFPRAIRLRNGDLRVRRDWYETWLGRLEGTSSQLGRLTRADDGAV